MVPNVCHYPVGKRVVDYLLVLIQLFLLALTVEALWADVGQNCGVWKGSGLLWAQISRGRGSSTNEFWRQKTRVPGLSGGVVCVILHLAVLIQYRRVTHTKTQTDKHTMMAITRASLAPRGVKSMQETEVITLNTKGAKVGLELAENRAMDTESRWEASD